MAEVARSAGVSAATVSRALRAPESVSPELRERVRAAAERLGYAPNRLAGSLAGTRSPLIGVIVPSLTNSFFAGTLERMSLALEERGFEVMLGHHDYDLDREERIIAAFSGWSPSALVVTGTAHTRGTIGLLSTLGCPVIEMWELTSRPIDSVVGFSNAEAGRLAARHLAQAGHRQAAFVGATLERDPRARARAEGFAAEFTRLTGAAPAIVPVDGREIGFGGTGLARVLEDRPGATAIAFSGDMLAVGAMFEAGRRGLSVPGDIALLGYGDLDIAAHTNPGLSTVRPPHDEIGEAVAHHLLDRLTDPARGGEVIELDLRMMARGSA